MKQGASPNLTEVASDMFQSWGSGGATVANAWLAALLGVWLSYNHPDVPGRVRAAASYPWSRLLEPDNDPTAVLQEGTRAIFRAAMPDAEALADTLAASMPLPLGGRKFEGALRRSALAMNRIEQETKAAYRNSALDLLNQLSPTGIRRAELADRPELNHLLAGLATHTGQCPETIYDPACGQCGTLVALVEALRAQGCIKLPHVYGQDSNLVALFWGVWSLILSGVHDFTLAAGDVLTEPRFLDVRYRDQIKRFDIVVSSLPLSPKLPAPVETFQDDPYRRFSHGPIPRASASWLFVQHAVASAKDDGVIVVTLSPSELSRTLPTDYELRSNLVHSGYLSKVILLPSGFLGGTSIDCAVLVLQPVRVAERESIHFIDGTMGFGTEASDVVAAVLDEATRPVPTPQKSAIAGIDKIRNEGYALTPERYVELPSLLDELPPYSESESLLRDLIGQLSSAQNHFLDALPEVMARLRE